MQIKIISESAWSSMTSYFKTSSIIGAACNPRKQIRERDLTAPSYGLHLNKDMVDKRHHRQLITHIIQYLCLLTLRPYHQVQSTSPQNFGLTDAIQILRAILLFTWIMSQTTASPNPTSTLILLRDAKRPRLRLNMSCTPALTSIGRRVPIAVL